MSVPKKNNTDSSDGDTDNAQAADTPAVSEQAPGQLPRGWLSRYPWMTFLLPIAVYMLVGSFEPAPTAETGGEAPWHGISIRYSSYPLIYSLKLALTVVCMLLVLPGYRTLGGRPGWLSVVVGVVGAVAWIAICGLQLQSHLFALLGLEETLRQWGLGSRPSFNPFAEIKSSLGIYSFLAIRLAGLVLVVPIVEEFFLRGFLMRYITSENWSALPLAEVSQAAIYAGTVVPMLMHPGELLAAAVWFSAVTWLMLRTGSIWSCIVAHMITNGLLGLYILGTDSWYLW